MDFSECLESMLLFMSDASLAGRNLKMMNVTAYGHLDAAGEGLEDTFYLVVLIGSLGLIWRFIRAESLSDLKKWRNISVACRQSFHG